MKKLFVVSGLVLAVFIAAISETSAQTIYSCYNNKSGAMRYVTGPGKCKKTETEISWITTGGPQGPAGPQGPTGAQGPQGPTGGANGIYSATYGTVFVTSYSSSWHYDIISGTGFSVSPLGSDLTQGVYIGFETPFQSPPHVFSHPVRAQTERRSCAMYMAVNATSEPRSILWGIYHYPCHVLYKFNAKRYYLLCSSVI